MKILKVIIILFGLLMVSSAADIAAGQYSGDWKSTGGGGNGSFKMSLEPGAGGTWKMDVVFSFGGTDVKTTMRTVKVEGSKIDASYDFDLMGNALTSHIKGELKGATIEGTYQTTAADGSAADEGVWNASRGK